MGCDCPDINNDFNFGYFIVNLLYYSKDSLFYSYIIQIILVVYGYIRFGKGKYWRTLLVASITGLLGGLLEKVCVVCTDHPDNAENYFIYILLFINEPCWIITEFAIPYLNMIKLKAVVGKDKEKWLKIFTGLAFILFSFFRFRIGYLRYSYHTVYNDIILHAHGYAFITMAITEFVCSIFIIKKMTKDYKKAKDRGINGNLYDYSRKSSLTILLLIDIIGFALAILSIFSNSTLEKILKPFFCLKSNSLLILAFDALVFKLDAKIHGLNTTAVSSSNNNIYSYGNISGNHVMSSGGYNILKDYKKEPIKESEKVGFLNEQQHLNSIPNLAYIPSTNSFSSITSIPINNFNSHNVKGNNNAVALNMQHGSSDDFTKGDITFFSKPHNGSAK